MSSRVVVTNISPMLEERHLKDLFGCFTIVDCQMEGMGDSRRCILTFGETQHAKAALLLSGTPLGDRPLQMEEMLGPTPTTTTTSSSSAAPSSSSSVSPAVVSTPILPSFPNVTATTITPVIPTVPYVPAPAMDGTSLDQVSRTIYVGNLAPNVCEEHLRMFFTTCGNILFIKMAGNPQQAVRYAFIEFDNPQSAQQALMLTGPAAMMGDRQLKIGPAMNPIVKPAAPPVRTNPKKLDEAMRRVEEARKRIARKHGADPDKDLRSSRSGSRSGSRRRSNSRSGRSSHRRSGDRDRGRYRRNSRERPRDRDRDGYQRKWRRSRSPPRDRGRYQSRYSGDRESRGGGGGGGGGGNRLRRPKKPDPHEGLVWDGFQWHRPVDLNADPTQLAAQAQKYFLKHGSANLNPTINLDLSAAASSSASNS